MDSSFWSGLACNWWWLLLGALLGLLGSWLLGRLFRREPPEPRERLVDRPVDRVVEKVVDNPTHLSRIRALETEVAVIAGLRAQIAQLQAATPKVVEKVVEKIVDRPVDRIVEKMVPDVTGLEERDARLRDLQRRHDDLLASSRGYQARITTLEEELRALKAPPRVDLVAAKAAGFSLRHEDDLLIIEGIGPKIAELFYAAGVKTFYALSQMTPAQIRPILDAGGPNFKLAVPDTWPEQAGLAANNRWTELAALQKVLDAGKR